MESKLASSQKKVIFGKAGPCPSKRIKGDASATRSREKIIADLRMRLCDSEKKYEVVSTVLQDTVIALADDIVIVQKYTTLVGTAKIDL